MQTELHRHLDASLRPATLLELAQERGLEAKSTHLESFCDKFTLRKPLPDLTSVLARFTLFQKVLDRPETLERIAFEGVEDCWREGTRRVELRYSPSFISEFSSLSWEDSLHALRLGLERGMRTYPDFKAGLICIASRDFGPEDVDKTVEFYLNHRDRLIGLDLAGNEQQFPCHLFETSFKKAKNQGARITIHSGEAAGPENIWEALELLGAERIGHGITCIQDPALMAHLAKNQICLEMCPTSNWLTSGVPSVAVHPLPFVLRAGIPVCINTDDPGIFGVSLTQEIQNCREQMGMTDLEIQRCEAYAEEASFF